MAHLSVKEVAKSLSVSEQYVRTLIRSKEIPAERIGNSWVIPDDIYDNNDFANNILTLKEAEADYVASYKKTPKYNCLSFFSGAMGLDIGVEKAGFTTILASEIDKSARATIRKNKPDIALIGDIRDYSASEIRKIAGLNSKDEIDLIVGGPPCQAFSTAGKRLGFDDARGNVFLYFLQIIQELKPKYAVLENVRGLLSAPIKHRPHERRGFGYPPITPEEEKGGALYYIVNIMEKAGYGVSFNLYNSANFGTPQKRERVVLICSRDGKKTPYIEPTHSENKEHGLPKWVTVKEALSGLEKIEHTHINFPEKRIKYYKLLKPGQYWKHLPVSLQKEALGASFYAGGGKTGFLRRLDWEKPSPTLVTNPAMPATDLAHPKENRPLSIEEYKRIQQFPDGWTIEGSILEKYKQIGNAVPCGLGFAIGKHIMKLLKGNKIRNITSFQYSRYKFTDDITWRKNLKLKSIKKDEQLHFV